MYDVIIPLDKSHLKQLLVNINFIRKNIQFSKIKILCDKKIIPLIPNDKDIECLDEDNIGNFDLKKIQDLIKMRGGDHNRAGWYFQQFLKMEYAFICKDKYYLIWDADTIPLSEIRFFSDDKKMLFNRKKEHHIPYFCTLDILFNKNLFYDRKFFITEGMIIECKIMKEIINDIKNNNEIYGNSWIEKIIYAISLEDIDKAGFSEFETYGNYILNKYPDKYKERNLKTLRNGMAKYGKILSYKELSKLDLDTITFENWNKNKKFSSKMKAFFRRTKLYINL